MKPIPEELRRGPFTWEQARSAGLSATMLRGQRIRRIHPRVYAVAGTDLSHHERIEAAGLALPADARVTGITALQELGLDFGPPRPLRFVVARDHHIALDDIFLHRTKVMPPSDGRSVSPVAAFVAYCHLARVIDCIKVGDWLLHHGHCDLGTLRAYALANLWRPGADEAIWVLPYLNGESRSLPESESRAIIHFAGLPVPEVNVRVPLQDPRVIIADLLLREWRTVIEYEGTQHQEDRGQYISDLNRYAVLRAEEYAYVQVTKETMRRPAQFARDVHRVLITQGYGGPEPAFGARWDQLFGSAAIAVGDRPARRQAPVS